MVHTTVLDPGPKHNQKNPDLVAHVERIESLEEEKQSTAGLIKDEYTVAASKGFDKKMLRKAIAYRRKLRDKGENTLKQEAQTLQSYMAALGMPVQLGLPLE